jgi:FAD/FMN-containing dehydrogenase
VSAFELISGDAMRVVREYLGGVAAPLEGEPDWMVLVELTSSEPALDLDFSLMQLLEKEMEGGLVSDAAVASSISDALAFWKLREEISDAQTRTGGSIKCDVSVPLSNIASFIRDASLAVARLAPGSRMVVYGHIGDGNVHFNPLRPSKQLAVDYVQAHHEAVTRAVDDLAHSLHGSISAEHGIGVAKRNDLSRYKSKVELELMWQLKRAIDPDNLLNPGKVLPVTD